MTEYDSISGRKFLLASKVQNWHGNLLCSIRWLRASQNDAGAARPQQQHESASTEKRKARRNGRHCCDPSERPTWMRSVDHQSVLHAPTANHRRSGSHAGQVALAGGHPQSLQGSFHWHFLCNSTSSMKCVSSVYCHANGHRKPFVEERWSAPDGSSPPPTVCANGSSCASASTTWPSTTALKLTTGCVQPKKCFPLLKISSRILCSSLRIHKTFPINFSSNSLLRNLLRCSHKKNAASCFFARTVVNNFCSFRWRKCLFIPITIPRRWITTWHFCDCPSRCKRFTASEWPVCRSRDSCCPSHRNAPSSAGVKRAAPTSTEPKYCTKLRYNLVF